MIGPLKHRLDLLAEVDYWADHVPPVNPGRTGEILKLLAEARGILEKMKEEGREVQSLGEIVVEKLDQISRASAASRKQAS